MPYVPFVMILREQSYTISRSLTCLSIFFHVLLLGKHSFIHFDNATFYRFGISFTQLLYAKLQQPVGGGGGGEKDPPHSYSKRIKTQDYTSNGFKQKGVLSFTSLKFKKGIHNPSFYITGSS